MTIARLSGRDLHVDFIRLVEGIICILKGGFYDLT